MKKDPDLHPDYHQIKVKMTDGTEFVTYSTYGKEGRRAASRHRSRRRIRPGPAAISAFMDRGGRLSRFKKKFEGIF